MKRIFDHIEFLLLKNDCVIVPGLGAFIVTHHPALVNLIEGVIEPPYNVISFNKAITVDDGLLSSSYARKFGLSFDEAKKNILNYTIKIKQHLEKQGYIKFGKIGILSIDDNEIISFNPYKRNVASSFNLGFLKIEKSLEITENNKEFLSDKKLTAPDRDPSFFYFRIKKKIVNIAAFFILFISVSLPFLLNPIPHSNNEQKASVVPLELVVPPVQQTEKIKKEDKEDFIPQSTNVVESDNHIQYYLIVATFNTEKEALKFIDTNSSDQYLLKPVASKKVVRVAIAQSDDKLELQKKLNSAEIQRNYPNSWIWTSSVINEGNN